LSLPRNPIRRNVPPYRPPTPGAIPREYRPVPVLEEPTPTPGDPAPGVDGLVLLIAGTGYSVTPLEPGGALALVRVTKSDGTSYNVARTLHGAECDCPAFTFDRAGTGTCKHVEQLERWGLLGAPPSPAVRDLPGDLTWEDLDDSWAIGPTPESRDATPAFLAGAATERGGAR
jgi:hypothetical protein